MSVVSIQYGQTGYIDPRFEYGDSGWTINGQYATHYPCFAGTMEYTPVLPFVNGQDYDFTYVVDSYISGGVRLELGSTIGTLRSAVGTYTETFTYVTGDILKFYSNGALRVTLLSVAPHLTEPVQNGENFAFHEPSNKWVENQSWLPENMINFSNRFFSFINGQMWEHETNTVAGNFYGVKYPCQIVIAVNVEYEKDKLWYNIRLDASGAWYATSITTPPTNQFPNGMLTKLKKNNVQLIDGKRWAAILRDITDPNFITKPEAEAIFTARQMQGGVLVVQFECNDNAPANMLSAEFYYTDVERSL